SVGWYILRKKSNFRQYRNLGIILLIVWLLFFTGTTTEVIKEKDPDWLNNYITAREHILKDEYTRETTYYDYSNPEVQSIINTITSNADSQEQAVEMALEYVYSNIKYIRNEPDDFCFNRKASDIIQYGTGQCDTQSTVLIAILRGVGIAARPVGGCLVEKDECRLQFALIQAFEGIGVDTRQPMITAAEIKDNEYSRGRRRGGLHLWVDYWDPTEEWITLETTAGKIANTNCWEYIVEVYPGDDDRQQFCVSINKQFANECYGR
ncbi:unnamed protein product, partial [marine sediment metagenome]